MERSPREQDAHTSPVEEGEKGSKYKGIRLRKWGKWVSEVRIPKSKAKIWLGSYATAEQAARAYDAAVFCLRGPRWKFNFPTSLPDIPSASSLSHRQIQLAAAKHAVGQIPSFDNLNETKSVSSPTEKVAAPSRLSPPAEMEASSDRQLQSTWCEGESLWGGSCLGWEESPSFDMAGTEALPPIDAAESIFFDPTDLWNL